MGTLAGADGVSPVDRWITHHPKSLLEATFRRLLNFFHALPSNRRDCQNGQMKSGSITR